MKRLPLYKDKRLPLEVETPRLVDSDCTKCDLYKRANHVCLPAVGEAGGVLIIGDWPGKYEDTCGEPFTGKSGRFVKTHVSKIYDGPIAYDYAVRCTPGKKPPVNCVDKCRGYLHQTVKDVSPTRVIVMGGKAAAGVFGASVPVLSARRGIGWLWRDGTPVPVFILMSPTQALRNRFLYKYFLQDLKWALTCDIDKQWKPPYDAFAGVIETVEDAEKVIAELYNAGGFTYDIETVGRTRDKFFKIISLAVTPYDADYGYVWSRDKLESEKHLGLLRKLMSDPSIPKTGTNVKYDHQGAEEILGCRVVGTDVDARLQRKMLFSDVSGYLEDMAYLVSMGGHKMEMEQAVTKASAAITKARTKSNKAAFLPGIEAEEIEEACKTELGPKTYAYGLVSKDLLHRYNVLDTVSTDRLRRWLKPQLDKQPSIKRAWDKIVSRTPETVAQIERWGMPVDRQAIVNYNDYLDVNIKADLRKLNDYNINPASNNDLCEILYKKFNLPVLAKTENGAPSVDGASLKKLAKLEHVKGVSRDQLKESEKFIEILLDFRALTKLQGTYAEGMLPHIRSDGRIHGSLNVDGASSGRASMRDPSLHTLPRADTNEYAKMARQCFMAAPGRKIISLDFSQLEYRVAALLSKDPVMLQQFKSGEDFHMSTARLIADVYFGVTPDQVDKGMRSQTKTFNFALLYGMQDRTLSERMGCSLDKARKLRAAIMGEWSDLAEWMQEQYRIAEKYGFIYTWWDGQPARRRPLWRIGNLGDDSKSKGEIITAKNGAVNTPPQGCLDFDTKVLTHEGYISVGTAKEAGLVWTGNEWAEYKKLNRGEWELAELHLDNGSVLKCDTRHSVLVNDGEDYVFKDYNNLIPGDSVCTSIAQPVEFGYSWDTESDHFYWMGFACGNGATYADSNELCITFGDRLGRYTKESKAAQFVQYINKYFEVPTQKPRVFDNKITVCAENENIKLLYKNHLGYCWGDNADAKRIPASVWTSALSKRKAFLLGFLDAGGTIGSLDKNGYRNNPNIHLCQKEVLQELQLLFRTVGVDSSVRGPYTYKQFKSYELSLVASQCAKYLDYGDEKRCSVVDPVPGFIKKDLLARCKPTTRSHCTLFSRMRQGGRIGVYTALDIYNKCGIKPPPLYATSKLINKLNLNRKEETFTLSVNHASHRFDSEGVISKNTASDFCVASLVEIVEWLQRTPDIDAKCILTVHDSILFDAADDFVDEVATNAHSIMTSHNSNGVPIVVDVEVGQSWGDLEKYEL